MSATTAAMAASSSVYTTPAFWERLWRTGGIQSLSFFIIAYVVYGHQPRVTVTNNRVDLGQKPTMSD